MQMKHKKRKKIHVLKEKREEKNQLQNKYIRKCLSLSALHAWIGMSSDRHNVRCGLWPIKQL